ncbi:acetolactate synthase 2 small subunit [Thalassotalea euphylliae]|uniref:acetolactate synthase 2 small subunit n=1 Tax=Thalassotalea euphylliae TaxID=1655234 RepID=UPI0036455A3F
MQQHTLRISAAQQPTVLEKLLQVTRYRGFMVTGITMFPQTESECFDIEMTVSSEQSVDQLHCQLNKLFDINQVEIQDTAMQQCRA